VCAATCVSGAAGLFLRARTARFAFFDIFDIFTFCFGSFSRSLRVCACVRALLLRCFKKARAPPNSTTPQANAKPTRARASKHTTKQSKAQRTAGRDTHTHTHTARAGGSLCARALRIFAREEKI
jgi:hypothetical protein